MAAHGLTDADGMAKAWFVDKNGRLSGGAEAINEAMRYCWWLRPFTTLYKLPGMRQLTNGMAKAWFVDKNGRLPMDSQ